MRGIGYALTVSVPSAVGIVSPYIGGYLISMYTLIPANRIAYLFSFLLGLVVASIRWKFLKETIKDTGEQVPLKNIGLLFKTSFQELLKSFRWMFDKLRAYAIITALISFAFSIASPFIVMYATQIIGLTTYEWGTLLLIGGAVQTVSSIPIGSFIDKHSCKASIVIGTIITCFSNLAFIFCRGYLQTLIVYMVLVVGHNFLFIGSSALMANAVPKPQRGRISAILGQGIITVSLRGGFSSGFLLFATSVVGSVSGGYIYALNPTYPWIIFPIVLGISAIISFKYIRDPEKVED